MASPAFEIWALGPTPAEDRKCAELEELAEVVSILRSLEAAEATASFEVRRVGRRVRIEGMVPPRRPAAPPPVQTPV